MASPRYSGQRPWGALGCSTYGMPKSVNKTVLAPGVRADDAESSVAIRGLVERRRPVPTNKY